MQKILIANRGEIARRIMRTCREMGIASVGVFSEPDRKSVFVSEAEEAVALGGATPADSYLRIDALIEAAQRTGCDGLHPGYGFLAESPALARACSQAGITFIGPSPEAIAAMGSKIEAKRQMETAGVPVLASIEVDGRNPDDVSSLAGKVDWPVLIKASAGGGGRGMRIVRGPSQLPASLEAARREAQSAFGDQTVFLETYLEGSRHVEIQIFGDSRGHVVHLFERECSIQRRHQKIIEESPSVALTSELRAAMGDAAVRAGQAIGYVGAGTVEFLLSPDGKFYFLEVNTRLQVEHPVTECLTGLDLVRLQILVADGEPLPKKALHATAEGHAIEARLYAEDALRAFLPSTGTLHRFRIPGGPGVRVETELRDGSEVSPYYDPLLAKVIVHAPTRSEAARRLERVLSRARLHGVTTNRDLLVRLLGHPEFLDGRTTTDFLDRHDPAELGRPLADEGADRLHAAAAALAAQTERRKKAPVLRSIPTGWRNNPSKFQHARLDTASGEVAVDYHWQRGQLLLKINGVEQESVRCERCEQDMVELEIDGVRRTYEVHHVKDKFYVDSPLGASVVTEVDRFPLPQREIEAGSLMAPLPGVVSSINVQRGDEIAAGDVLVVIESMKVLHRISAPAAGRVADVCVGADSHVEAGAVLIVIDESTAESSQEGSHAETH